MIKELSRHGFVFVELDVERASHGSVRAWIQHIRAC